MQRTHANRNTENIDHRGRSTHTHEETRRRERGYRESARQSGKNTKKDHHR